MITKKTGLEVLYEKTEHRNGSGQEEMLEDEKFKGVGSFKYMEERIQENRLENDVIKE